MLWSLQRNDSRVIAQRNRSGIESKFQRTTFPRTGQLLGSSPQWQRIVFTSHPIGGLQIKMTLRDDLGTGVDSCRILFVRRRLINEIKLEDRKITAADLA